MSTLPPSQLPRSMKWSGTQSVCVVESLIDGADLKLKNRHWYNMSRQFIRADFDLKILIGPADLKFQLWGRNRQISKDHEQIVVQWNPVPIQGQSIPAGDVKSEMYRNG